VKIAAALLATIATASAQQIPASQLQHLQWRSIGPYRGGRVLTVQGAPDNRNRFYFGAVNGGVWRTDDAGRTWQPIADSLPIGSIGALAIAPSAPQTIYIGTGEADMRSDIAQGAGLFRTTDGGAHWTPTGLADTQQIGRILVDPRNPNTLLVAALGHPYGPNAERGIFRSEDGGQSWTKTLFHDADTGAIDMAAAPDNPDVIYAALWQTRRPPWNVYPPSSGPGSGLYKSTDGGRTWSHLTTGGLPAVPGRIGLATTPARPHRVYALIECKDPTQAGLYRSDDDGATWTHTSTDKRITERAWYFSGITAEPKDADTLYVMDTIVLRSTDGGAHFTPLKGDPTGDDFHALWIDPTDPTRRILGVDQGTLVSLNAGATWSSWFNQPTGQFYHVSTDNRFPYRVYGAQQDSGAASVSSRAENPFDGIGLSDFHESAAGGESDNIAPDPDDPDTVYGGRVDKLDLRTGQIQSLDPTLAFPDNYRATWTLPLAFGPQDHALYFGNQRIFRTADGGQHWQPISPDLTRPNPPIPATLDAPTAADITGMGARRGVVYAIAPSPLYRDLLWAGTDDGLVWRTRDGGGHWSDVTPPTLQPWSKIGIIEASHFDAATAYLAVDRHRLDDQTPYLYRTHDSGAHWDPITRGLPPGAAANVIREDPKQRGLLFAGTEHGAWFSLNDGTDWQPLQNSLPATSVRDITIHTDDLVIATHGRGFYILDDITSLRALATHPASKTTLFPMAGAIRLHPPQFTGTPLPHDEPMAANPPNGAIIDYALDAETPVQIDIQDSDGHTIRHFSSSDPAPTADPATLPLPPEWLPPHPNPPTSPGTHRFVWDLRLEQPPALKDTDPPVPAVLAPPGAYTVVLTTQGTPLRQALRVIPDPRVKLPQSAFDAEYRLALTVQADRLRCHQALTAHPEKLPDNAPVPPTSLTGIAARLDKLALAADGADAAPTPDALSGVAAAERDLGASPPN